MPTSRIIRSGQLTAIFAFLAREAPGDPSHYPSCIRIKNTPTGLRVEVTAAEPELASMTLVAAGLLGLRALRRKRA